jgi:phasin family protein
MFSFTEQFSAATATAKSQLDKQLDKQLNIANEFATTAFDGVQQIIALNVSTTKASVEKSSAAAKQLFEAKDPSEFFKAPNFDGLLAYSRELVSIASRTQAELLEVVKEQIKDAAEAGAAAAKPLSLVGGSASPAAAPAPAPVAAPAAVPAAAAAPVKAPAAAVPPAPAAAPVAAKAEEEPAAPATVVTPPAPKAVTAAVAEAVNETPAQEEAPAQKAGKAKGAAAKPAQGGEAVSAKSAKPQK